MALFVLLGALVWLSNSSGCFCFVGSWGPAVLFGFSSHPSSPLCPGFRRGRVRVDRGGGLEKGSLAGEVGGKGVFVFFCLGFVFVFSVMFLFCCVFGFCFCSVLCVVGVV